MNRPVIIFSVFAIPLLFSSAWSVPVKPDPIRLISEKSLIIPTEYYIKNVSDRRPKKLPVGELYFAYDAGKAKIYPVDLYNGAEDAIKSFIMGSIIQKTIARPINIKIKECRIRETISGDNIIHGEINLLVEFDLEKNYGDIRLTQHSAIAKYTRSINKINVVEPILRQLLVNSLKYINTWMNKESLRHPLLATKVSLTFTDYLEFDEDTIYHHPSRPLVWADFREKPQDQRYSAAVFSSFGYDQHREIINGTIHVNLAIKSYVVKSASWVFPSQKDAYGLNHEQKHFDIVKIIADRFKSKLLSEDLHPDNYEGTINFEYLEFYREMNSLQKKYDSETAHGRNSEMQKKWDREITNEVESVASARTHNSPSVNYNYKKNVD